jgi:hypothetical protein
MNLTCTAAQVTSNEIPGCRRAEHVAGIFGAAFPFVIEPRIFITAESLSHIYRGGCWEMYALSNGGFYMAPETDRVFPVSAANGFEGGMSADAFGITACLYVFSLASFDRRKPRLAGACAEHFHLLREFAADHPEAAAILGATD